MAVKVGINGFGRIGRISLRAMLTHKTEEFDVVAINDLSDPKMLAMLLKYDSAQGRFPGTVNIDGNTLIVKCNGKTSEIKVLAERNPANLPWGEMGVQVALESTGFFTSKAKDAVPATETAPAQPAKPGYDSHLTAGAQKVVISAPAKDAPDLTCVMGVNDHLLTADVKTVSNASCTTNCLAPMAMVLDREFGGLQKGLMTTVHAYTNDQRLADQIHSDIRRARAAAVNIIPTSTGAAKAVGQVLPHLDGKLTGISLRVPVPTGSVTDLVAVLGQDVTVEEINAAMKAASEKEMTGEKLGKDEKCGMKGIMEYTEDPIVSSDIVGNPHSSIFDASWTQVIGGNMVKVLSWYDNEFGYSSRTADLIAKLAKL